MHKMQGREKKKRDRKEEHTREEEGKQKMSCKEGQHLKLCSPKSEKKHSNKRSGREEELPPCNCPGRQAGRHDSPWQSQSPHLKGFLFWGNKAVRSTHNRGSSPPHTKFHTHKHTTKSACRCTYYISIYTIYI